MGNNGKQWETDSGIRLSETYNSHGLVVFGFVGEMLTLTQAAWAPDIISGLIILNSKMVEEGDILQIRQDGKQVYANVYKTKMLHTELLDISNNHRMMIKNSQLRALFLQNLSK